MYHIYWTRSALEDLKRLYLFLVKQDINSAKLALDKIKHSTAILSEFPFISRPVNSDSTLRELLIPFGSNGYLLLFRINNKTKITVLAVRHQKEEDYY